MFVLHMALCSLFKDFMAHANGRCTLMGKEKICLKQDVSFGTCDIDMHRLTFTIFYLYDLAFSKHLCTYSLNMPVLCLSNPFMHLSFCYQQHKSCKHKYLLMINIYINICFHHLSVLKLALQTRLYFKNSKSGRPYLIAWQFTKDLSIHGGILTTQLMCKKKKKKKKSRKVSSKSDITQTV